MRMQFLPKLYGFPRTVCGRKLRLEVQSGSLRREVQGSVVDGLKSAFPLFQGIVEVGWDGLI